MSEISGQTGLRGTANAVVHESYSFACMRCGHGWEQSYAIEHHTDAEGNEFVMYVAGGRMVPSPLRHPECGNCDGHDVRIMRAGRVSSVQNQLHNQLHPQHLPTPPRTADTEATEASPTRSAPVEGGGRHRWHLSDLLHPFQRKAS